MDWIHILFSKLLFLLSKIPYAPAANSVHLSKFRTIKSPGCVDTIGVWLEPWNTTSLERQPLPALRCLGCQDFNICRDSYGCTGFIRSPWIPIWKRLLTQGMDWETWVVLYYDLAYCNPLWRTLMMCEGWDNCGAPSVAKVRRRLFHLSFLLKISANHLTIQNRWLLTAHLCEACADKHIQQNNVVTPDWRSNCTSIQNSGLRVYQVSKDVESDDNWGVIECVLISQESL